MERLRPNSRQQFPKGMRVCRESQRLLAPSFPFDPKGSTDPSLREEFEEPVHQSENRPTINRSRYPGDCVRTTARWIRFPSSWNQAISLAMAIDERHDTSHLLPSSGVVSPYSTSSGSRASSILRPHFRGGKIANKATATLSMSAFVISTVSHANRIIGRWSLRFLGQRPFCFCSERLGNALSRHRALLAQHPLRLSADKRFRFVG